MNSPAGAVMAHQQRVFELDESRGCYPGLARVIAASTDIELVEWEDHARFITHTAVRRRAETLASEWTDRATLVQASLSELDAMARRIDEMLQRVYLPLVEPFEDYLWSA